MKKQEYEAEVARVNAEREKQNTATLEWLNEIIGDEVDDRP